jgi:hypothetical protein
MAKKKVEQQFMFSRAVPWPKYKTIVKVSIPFTNKPNDTMNDAYDALCDGIVRLWLNKNVGKTILRNGFIVKIEKETKRALQNI